MSEGFLLRVCYRIGGRLAYLSHLETIRSVERIVRRAQLPYAVTEGFSPHMKIAFGPALPVGAGSCGEFFDVRLTSYVSPEEALELLQAAAPENLMPLSCAYIGSKDDSISVAYPRSDWSARFALSRADDVAELSRAFAELVNRGFIEVEKKKGRKVQVKRVEFEGRLVELPVVELDGSYANVHFSTVQGDAGALRPDKFIEAALELCVVSVQLVELTRLQLRTS